MNIRVECPYKTLGNMHWHKGCVHCHSLTRGTRPHYPPRYIVPFMRKLGFDFMIITDHDYRLKVAQWCDDDWSYDCRDFLIIKGFEFSHSLGHLGIPGYLPDEYEIDNMNDDFINCLNNDEYMVILNHPFKWKGDRENLLTAPFLDKVNAVEVYSGKRITAPNDRGLTADVWDVLLSEGKKLWAIASPDCHSFILGIEDSPLNGFQMVCVRTLDEKEILKAIRNGLTYASSGIIVDKIEVTDSSYYVESENATKINFIGLNGQILEVVEAGKGGYSFKGNEGYVRAELHNDTPAFSDYAGYNQSAWLQPAFIINR